MPTILCKIPITVSSDEEFQARIEQFQTDLSIIDKQVDQVNYPKMNLLDRRQLFVDSKSRILWFLEEYPTIPMLHWQIDSPIDGWITVSEILLLPSRIGVNPELNPIAAAVTCRL